MKMIFAVLGVIVIVLQTLALGQNYRGLDSPLWGYLLGLGLIAAPSLAVGMFATYALIILALFGSAGAGFVIVKELTDSPGLGLIGLIGGAAIGFKFIGSDYFDRLLEPLRRWHDNDRDK